MKPSDFEKNKESLTISQLQAELASKKPSGTGINYYTKLIKKRVAARQKEIVDEIKAQLVAGGAINPKVVFCSEPKQTPGPTPELTQVKYYVEVHVNYIPTDDAKGVVSSG